MPGGYVGKILFVDLTTGVITEETPPKSDSKVFLLMPISFRADFISERCR